MQQSINRSLEPTTSPSKLSTKANDFFKRRAGLLTLLAAGSCSPGEIGQEVRPKDPTAAETMGESSCVIPEDHSNPLIVDWKNHQRDDLEIAMKKGVVVVSYDCKTLKMLPDCTVDSSYGFMPTTTKEQVVRLENKDELKANLPTFGSKIGMELGASLDRETTIDIALVTVGRVMTTRSTVSENLLQGNCKGATHFIRGATVGAFAMQTGTKGEVKTAAELFGAGVSTGSLSTKSVNVKNGDIEECKKASTEISDPQPGCSTPIRLHLTAIGKEEAQEVMKPEERIAAMEACPEDFVMSEGKCTKEKEVLRQCKAGDLKDCTEQCEAGSIDSCNRLGNIYSSKDAKKAAELYQKACDGGSAVGCANLGGRYFNGRGVEKDVSKAAELYEKACNDGLPEGCFNLGFALSKGSGVSRDFQKIAKLYQKACDGGVPESCFDLGVMHSNGRGVVQNAEKAAKLYQKACDGGLPSGCSKLGVMYADGKGVKKNPQKAAELFQKACDDDLPEACGNLGIMYADGKGLKKNLQKASGLFQKACDGGLPEGCTTLGHMYRKGAGVPQDRKRAIYLYQKACDSANPAGCNNIGYMFLEAKGMKKDLGKVAEIYQKACNGGSPTGCNNLGVMYESGEGVSKNAMKAVELYQKACSMGKESSCGILRKRGIEPRK